MEASNIPSPVATSFVEHRGELVRFLSGRLGCRATAEDIAHDVYLKLDATKGEGHHFRALLFRIAKNLAFNHRRDENRRAEIRRDVLEPSAETVDHLSPERTVIARDQLRRIAISLDRWPPRMRDVFILNRYEGMNQREIAEHLGISVAAVEKHMTKALRRFADSVVARGR
jgi:RNA polymerase sigma factor (sigma-70 family)